MASARPALLDGEQDYLQFSALLKKHLGDAFVSNQRFLWLAVDAQAPVNKVELAWSAVKDHMVSPATAPKAMIRLNLAAAGQAPIVLEVLNTPQVSAADMKAKARAAINRGLRTQQPHLQQNGSSSNAAPAAAAPSAARKRAAGEDELDDTSHRRGVQTWGSNSSKSNNNSSSASASAYKRQRTDLQNSVRGGQAMDLSALSQPHSSSSSASGSGSAHRFSAEAEAQIRASLLASDAALRAQHAEVVEGGILTEAEFWASRRSMLEGEAAAQRARRQGMRSARGADVRPTLQGNKQVYRLTPNDIRQIWQMYPAVRRAYEAKVPHELSEKEFWVKYFQSQYYTKDKGGGASKSGAPAISAGDDMFSRYAAEVEAEQQANAAHTDKLDELKVRGVDPTVDLTRQWADYHLREVDDRPPTERASAEDARAMLRSLNKEAALKVQPHSANTTSSSSNQRLLPPPQDTPYAATDLPELHEPVAPRVQPLQLEHKGRYSRSADLQVEVEVSSSANGENGANGGVQKQQQQQQQALPPLVITEPNLKAALPSPARAREVLLTCTRETNAEGAAASGGSGSGAAGYPQDYVTRMHRHFQIIGELLRHFYAALASSSSSSSGSGSGSGSSAAAALMNAPEAQATALKLERLTQKMEAKYEELRALRASLPRDAQGSKLSALIKPMTDCLDHAFVKYEAHRGGAHNGMNMSSSTGIAAAGARRALAAG